MYINSKRQSKSNGDMLIHLPNFLGLYEILIIAFLIFPWYVIINNRNFSGAFIAYLLGNHFLPKYEYKEYEECEFSRTECSFLQFLNANDHASIVTSQDKLFNKLYLIFKFY